MPPNRASPLSGVYSKCLLHCVKELLKLYYKFFCSFALKRFVDEIFQFEFFVLSANWVTLCIMSCC